MRVFLTGATGFIGRALVAVLHRDGHQVVAWVRSSERARGLLGADVETLSMATTTDDSLVAALQSCDAVVNLAGEPILGGRWTESRRRQLTESRVQLTDRLVEALALARPRPRVLVSSSAVGIYGDRGDEVLDERSPLGHDFLATLCQAWETSARRAEVCGVRVVLLRTSVVLGRDGGALAQMLPPFRLGVGGPIGNGRQFMPWMHLHDFVQVVATALVDERYTGPINAVAPEEVRSRDFARVLGAALHRPSVLPAPAFALRAVFGDAACVLLGSQRVQASRLRELGFPFAFPTLARALEDVVSTAGVDIAPASGDAGGRSDDPKKPKAAYRLRASTVIDAPLDETYGFFSRAENLGLLTPAGMRFRIAGPAPTLGVNATIDYTLRVGPVSVRWRTRIARWAPPRSFVDIQERGPYNLWWHEHSFRAEGARTVMEDCVFYTPPFGVLGRLVHGLFIAPTLRGIFAYRGDVIRLRFGKVLPAPAIKTVA